MPIIRAYYFFIMDIVLIQPEVKYPGGLGIIRNDRRNVTMEIM